MVKHVKVDVNAIKNIRRPDPCETDADWQEFFQSMRLFIPARKQSKITHKDIVNHNSQFYDIANTKKGEELWRLYCAFINSVLSSIRHGEVDYCFCIFQIAELLQFENDKLRTKWIPRHQCFEVWIDPEGV